MGDPWGIGGFRGGDKPNIKQIVKKKNQSKNLKNRRNRKKSEKSDFFFTENGLKCIRNSTKHLYKFEICQKNHKIFEIGENRIF